jgi:hypothetical protein
LEVQKNEDLNFLPVGSFSEQFEKFGRGFIKILETWQFGLWFNIKRHVFFCFDQKFFFVALIAQKKS